MSACRIPTRPRWAVNGVRDCRRCEGSGEVETSDSFDPQDSDPRCCPVCFGSGNMPTDWARDPLIVLAAHRRGQWGRMTYKRLRAIAMEPVRLPGVAL